MLTSNPFFSTFGKVFIEFYGIVKAKFAILVTSDASYVTLLPVFVFIASPLKSYYAACVKAFQWLAVRESRVSEICN